MTSSDGFFAVRQAAWHGLGHVFEDYPKREEAQQLAHPWEPAAVPIFTKITKVEKDPITGQEVTLEHYEEIQGHVANIRDDNRHELGVVPKSYNLVQNSQLWDVAQALEQSGPDVMYETGGSYGGGKGVWVLIRLKEPLMVKGDPHGETIPYYALQNNHDGTGAFRGQATMTRIVCANTSQIADMEAKARGTSFSFRHSKNVDDRIEEAREALAGWRQALADWQDTSQDLITKPVSEGNAVRFLHKFIPMPPRNLISEKVEQNVYAARAQWKEAYEGITGEGIKGTAYGLVQASIEYQEWYRRANNSESRFKRSFLSRNTIVSDAVALALTASSESIGS
jgi:phage/plasmid-like protein (TIGR03299 family)